MKTKSKISGPIIRSVVYAVFLSVAFIALSSASNSSNTWYKSAMATGGYNRMAKSPSQPRAFSFVERVVFQRAIEDVYWRHRIWPKENPDPKPSLDAVMSQGQLENKVAGYLRDSLALEDYRQKPITAEQLQAEMDRMAGDTKQSEVLRELFEALGNDPAVIAECLARPTLAEHLIADLSAQDRTRHVESAQSDALRAMSAATTLGQVVYTLPEIANACTDQWGATTTFHAPSERSDHTAVWTGSEMIVWGGAGESSLVNTGGKYNPSTDTWTATSTTNAPDGRVGHTAIWTGTEMIVWGGFFYDNPFHYLNTGGRYNPGTDSWTVISTTNAPSARYGHTAVWTGSAMVVWGGSDDTGDLNTGGRYNPSTNSWTATSTVNAPVARDSHTAVWTGSEMIVWGGVDNGSSLNTGGRYNPGTNSWTSTNTSNAPAARYAHTAVWTASEMIVWGGWNASSVFNTGGKYDPRTDSWTATSTTNAPERRYYPTAVSTGSEMIVWGGHVNTYPPSLNTGGIYNPSTDSWIATTTINAPSARERHTAVWTGSEMIVWGGTAPSFTNTGGRYCGGPYPTPSPTPTPTSTPPLRPPNDDFADAILLTGANGTVTGTNVNATTENGEPLVENTVWYRWTAPNNGNAHFYIGMDWLKIDVFTGSAITALTRVARSSGSPSAVTWTAVEGTTYRIRLYKNTRMSTFTLVWSLIVPPPNDAFASAELITGANGTVTGSNVDATTENGEPLVENTVWYRWTAPNNGNAHFSIGMDWLTIDVFTGSAITALTRIARSSGSPSAVTWTAVEGTTYRIRLYKNTRMSTFTLVWSL